MPRKYIKRKTKPVATYGETGEENKIQWITKSVGTFTGGGGGGTGTVDTEMSDTSTNAVQNKVIKEYVDKADENLTKVMPTDINVDSNGNLILEHDGVEITGQKKLITPLIRKNYNVNVGEWETPLIWLNNNNKRSGTLTFGEFSTRFKFEYWDDNSNQSICYLDIPTTTDEVTLYNILTDKNINTYITGKLDKSTSKKMAYVNDADGNPAMVEYSLLPGNSNIAQFDTNGHLYTEYPSMDTHAANKKYVDDAVSGISLGIDVINIEYNPDTLAPVGTYDVSVFETAKKRTTKVLLTATGESYGILCDKTLENLDEPEPNLMFASGLDEAHNYYVIDMDLRDGSVIIQISKEQGQAALESGVNIKTVNGESLLGSGNITIETIKVVEISDVPAEVTNGTLTDEQLTTLQSYDGNYIMFNHEKYYLQDKGYVEGYLTYTHTGYENNQMWLKSITITIATKTWVLNVVGVKPTVVLTQSDYDNLAVKDANTLYYIIG